MSSSTGVKLLSPPIGWSTVKGGICRASVIATTNLPFLKMSQIRTVIVFEHPDSSSSIPAELASYGINLVRIAATLTLESRVLRGLEAALNPAAHPVVLTSSSVESFDVSVWQSHFIKLLYTITSFARLQLLVCANSKGL